LGQHRTEDAWYLLEEANLCKERAYPLPGEYYSPALTKEGQHQSERDISPRGITKLKRKSTEVKRKQRTILRGQHHTGKG